LLALWLILLMGNWDQYVPADLVSEWTRRADLTDSLFPEQLAAIRDPSTLKCIWTTARAGKTRTVLTDFFDDGLRHPGNRYNFIALTSNSAAEIAWPEAKEIDRDHHLGCTFTESRLRITMPGGSWIRIYGADRPGWMDRLYGQKFRRTAFDEAAFFHVDLESFIVDVLRPRAIDLGGQIYLSSIPGYIPRGLFHEVIKGFPERVNMSSVPSPTKPGWSVHSWTTEDNPWMRAKFIADRDQQIAENPDIVDDPRFRRNYLGETIIERGQRVYGFDPDKNGLAEWEHHAGDRYVLGLDFGWDDQTAFSLCVWREDSPHFVEIESYSEKEMLLDKAASFVRGYVALCEPHGTIDIVGDPAHKQLFEEFRRRYDLPIMPAEKTDKYAWIELVNNDLALNKIKICVPEKSPHVEEMQGLTWKVLSTGRRIEQPGAPNDVCDAFLVAYRHAYHYRYEAPVPELPKEQLEEQRMLALVEARAESSNDAWWE